MSDFKSNGMAIHSKKFKLCT